MTERERLEAIVAELGQTWPVKKRSEDGLGLVVEIYNGEFGPMVVLHENEGFDGPAARIELDIDMGLDISIRLEGQYATAEKIRKASDLLSNRVWELTDEVMEVER